MIQTISDIGQTSFYVQAENHFNYVIREKQLPNLKRPGRVIKSQATTTERSQSCVSQQYRWQIMIEAEWENLWWTNSPRDIFTHFSHYFQLNFDETSFLCNLYELKVLGRKINPDMTKIAATQGLQ